MNKLKQALMRFMQGRYGADELSRTISWAAVLIYLFALLFNSSILITLGMVLIVYNIYRMFSRDYWGRSAENRKYLDFIRLSKMRFDQRKTHRIFKCKKCGKNIRIPKGKGKIEVRCPNCGNRSIHRT